MTKSLDKVLQPDGSYKWELVEPTLSERMGNGPEACPTPETAKTESKKKAPKKKSTNILSD
tara:strand:- start:568 stop:750 length:183 start_codon:yes stop_codon:yes gene_type:complete